jgi:hypothetical protein
MFLAPVVAKLELVPAGITLLQFHLQAVVTGVAAGIEVVAAGKSRIRPALLYRTRVAGRDKAFGIDCTKEYETPIGRPIKIANSLDDTAAEPFRELL